MLRRSMMAAAAGGGGTWSEVASFIPDSVSTGWVGYTARQRIVDARLSGATRLRFTLRCAAGHALSVAKAYVGITSGSAGFSGVPQQLLFGGMPGFSASGLVDTVSDEVALPVVGTSIVVSAFFNADSALVHSSGLGLGGQGYYKLGDDAANALGDGYSNSRTNLLFVKVEKL